MDKVTDQQHLSHPAPPVIKHLMQLLLSCPHPPPPQLPMVQLLPVKPEDVLGSVQLAQIQKRQIRDLEIKIFES
ncbi:unnamed protein product [Caenorhabditis nigoni]